MDFQGISLNFLLSPPSSSFEGRCQMELRFLPSVAHQQDNDLPSMPALMQHYGAKQGSGCLREQISEQSFHWTLNGCRKLKMGRDLLGHLGFAPLAQSSRDHLHCTETQYVLFPHQHSARLAPRGRRKGFTCCEILTLTRPRGPSMASDTSWLASLHSVCEKS